MDKDGTMPCSCSRADDGTPLPQLDACPKHQPVAVVELDLSTQGLQHPPALCELVQLQVANLSFNRIRGSLPDVTGCDRLIYLNISHNRITDLRGINFAPSLTTLNASHNNIVSLAALAGCSQLQELWLDNNSIVSLREVEHIADINDLARLIIHANPFCKTINLEHATSYTIDMLEALETVSLTGALQAVTSSARSVASKFVRSQAASDLVRELNAAATDMAEQYPQFATTPRPLHFVHQERMKVRRRRRRGHGGDDGMTVTSITSGTSSLGAASTRSRARATLRRSQQRHASSTSAGAGSGSGSASSVGASSRDGHDATSLSSPSATSAAAPRLARPAFQAKSEDELAGSSISDAVGALPDFSAKLAATRKEARDRRARARKPRKPKLPARPLPGQGQGHGQGHGHGHGHGQQHRRHQRASQVSSSSQQGVPVGTSASSAAPDTAASAGAVSNSAATRPSGASTKTKTKPKSKPKPKPKPKTNKTKTQTQTQAQTKAGTNASTAHRGGGTGAGAGAGAGAAASGIGALLGAMSGASLAGLLPSADDILARMNNSNATPVGEWCVKYKKSNTNAVYVRADGGAVAKWPSGNLAVSVDVESGGEDGTLYRLFVMDQNGDMLVNFDNLGAGQVCLPGSGVTVLSAQTSGAGFRADSRGVTVARWDSKGVITPEKRRGGGGGGGGGASGEAADALAADPTATLVFLRLNDSLGVVYNIKDRSVQVWFQCRGVKHCLVQGHNHPSATAASPPPPFHASARSGASSGGGNARRTNNSTPRTARTSRRSPKKKHGAASTPVRGSSGVGVAATNGSQASPKPVTHAQTLADIRAAVSSL